jgi:hypothetical protein
MAVRIAAKSKFQQPFDPLTAVLLKMIQALTFFFILAVLFMNPVAKKGIIDPKAEYLVTVTWPDNNPDDIDTWVEDPNGEIVWFRSRDAGLIHLDRDDRGMLNDTLDINGNIVKNPLNQEVVTIRGVVPGEYIVNVHYYATETEKPVAVTVKVDKVNPTLEVIYYDTLTLDKKGDEKTALRFRINQDGRVSDIGHTPKSLVVATKR